MTFKSGGPVALAAAMAALLFAGSAAAVSLTTVSGSGVWAHTAPTTAYSAPDASYSFSFQLPKIYSPGNDADGRGTDIGTSDDFSNYNYTLGGTPVAGRPVYVYFYSVAYGGGFALAYPTTSIEFYGPVDVGSSGTINWGNYPFTPYVAIEGEVYAPVNQGATPTVTSIVPEPATWALAFVGFGAAGGMIRFRRKAVVEA